MNQQRVDAMNSRPVRAVGIEFAQIQRDIIQQQQLLNVQADKLNNMRARLAAVEERILAIEQDGVPCTEDTPDDTSDMALVILNGHYILRADKIPGGPANITILSGNRRLLVFDPSDDMGIKYIDQELIVRLQSQVDELTTANEYLVGEKTSSMQKITNLEVEVARFKQLWKTAEAEASDYENGMRKLLGDRD